MSPRKKSEKSGKSTSRKAKVVDIVEAESSTRIERPAEVAEPEPLSEPPKPAPPKKPEVPEQCREFCELYKKFDVTDVVFSGMTGVSVEVIQRWKTVASAPKSIIDLLKHKVAQKR